jgi:outer membrane protein assembly factor BamB
VLAYDDTGKFLWSVGSEGNGPGQFAQFSPEKLTIGPDGNIYALDRNETNNDEELLRVQVFSPEGKYLREIEMTEEWFTADDLDFGSDGNLYILSGNVQYILVLDPQGTVVGRIGNAPLSESYIYTGLDIDGEGNIYIATGYQERGILKLDRYGDLVAQFGATIEDGERPWPEGGFYSPSGIGVMPDGSAILVSDWSGPYAYLTAFTFK